MIRGLGLLVFVFVASSSLAAESTELPAGRVSSVLVEDDGRALVLVTKSRFDPRDGSSLVLLEGTEAEIVDLPEFLGTGLTPLTGGRALLLGRMMSPPGHKGDWAPAMEIVQPGSDEEFVRSWKWKSWDFWVSYSMHFEYLFDIAGDGQVWERSVLARRPTSTERLPPERRIRTAAMRS